jgi:hypothetical protein
MSEAVHWLNLTLLGAAGQSQSGPACGFIEGYRLRVAGYGEKSVEKGFLL